VKVILAALLFGLGSGVAADECADRTEQGLVELSLVFPAMDEVQAADAERILREVCVEPVTSPSLTEPDTPSVMGIEFNKAEADSKGHSRLKKSH
jgi:hypothetical protein